MSNSRWDAIVIGGGAAGLWAAGTAALRGRRVLVLEKNNKPGPKILMSGGTRCNITHHCDSKKIAEAFGKNGKALLSPLQRLSPSDVVQEFSRMGVATKVEDTGKVFPVSNRAIDVRDALVKRLDDAGGSIRSGVAAQNVVRSPIGLGFEIQLQQETLWAEKILVATGGLSYSGCGTTGDGYPWLEAMGHRITPLRPALTPLLSHDEWVHELSGITLDDVFVQAFVPYEMPEGSLSKQARRFERSSSRGGFLWTHFGCSGPTAMNVSRFYTGCHDLIGAKLLVDMYPESSHQSLDDWLVQESKGARTILSTMAQRVPRRVVEVMLKKSQVRADIRMSELSRTHRSKLVSMMKQFEIPIHGTRGYAKAEVTAGGVDLGEVNFQSMQSRKVDGLFLAGEILDLDGPIGGFNFQAAWSTGHTAGLHL